jgi:hypothetical protein
MPATSKENAVLLTRFKMIHYLLWDLMSHVSGYEEYSLLGCNGV